MTEGSGGFKQSDLLGGLVIWLFLVLLIGGLFGSLRDNFGQAGGPLGWLFGSEEGVLTEETPLGTDVIVDAGPLEVWNEAAGDELLGTQEEGATGRILEGPEDVDGELWWFVDFAQDPDGWVKSDALRENETWQIGDPFELVLDTDVWNEAGGGVRAGFQKAGALGKLVNGFVFENGERWWEVDFVEGVDGWIRESVFGPEGSTTSADNEADTGTRRFGLAQMIGALLSLLILLIIMFILWRIARLEKAEEDKAGIPDVGAFVRSPEERALATNPRWDRVEKLIGSDNPSDWRQAIMEADVILDEMVTKMGYPGNTLGEQLKEIDRSDFLTLDQAWEAHKVRNKIAHEGGDFILTQREARRVVGLYEEVFREFKYL